MRHVGWLAVVIVAWPVWAAAQAPRVVVGALGGATVGTTSGPFIGGRVSGSVGGIQPFGELGWVGDALPNSIRDLIDEALVDFESAFGPVEFDVRLRAVYGLGGVRWVLPMESSIRPYVEGGLGFARLSASFTVRFAGMEFTEDDSPLGLPTMETDQALGLGGGVLVPMSERASLDVGYRYVLIGSGERIHLHKLLAGVSVGW